MYINSSNTIQSIQDGSWFEKIYPGEIVSENVFSIVKSLKSFKKIESLNVEAAKSILLKRQYALGDVLMLIPIINYLRRIGKEAYIVTSKNYSLPCTGMFKTGVLNKCNADIIVRLDGVVERDHSDSKLFKVPRLDIFLDYLNIKLDKVDWNVHTYDAEFPKGVIGIQLSGSAPFKTIDLSKELKVLSKNNKLFILDKNKVNFKNPNIFWENVNNVLLLSYMKKMKGIVCFDSGPLWLSHLANIPAFVIVGPTDGKKVIRYHPNKKTMFYTARPDVGCKKACGESAGWCGKSYKCMKNIDHKRLLDTMKEWLRRL